MKKVLLLAVVALFVMMPLASFAMTTISDSDLNAITAQEGVSIYFNDLSVATSLNNITMSWGQGTVNTLLTGAQTVNPFTNGGFFGAIISTGNIGIGINGLMTIDVGINTNNSDARFATGVSKSDTSGVGGIAIGLSNMRVDLTGLNMTMVIRAGAEKTLSATSPLMVNTTTGAGYNPAGNTYLTMGTAYVGIGAINTTINGQVVISTH